MPDEPQPGLGRSGGGKKSAATSTVTAGFKVDSKALKELNATWVSLVSNVKAFTVELGKINGIGVTALSKKLQGLGKDFQGATGSAAGGPASQFGRPSIDPGHRGNFTTFASYAGATGDTGYVPNSQGAKILTPRLKVGGDARFSTNDGGGGYVDADPSPESGVFSRASYGGSGRRPFGVNDYYGDGSGGGNEPPGRFRQFASSPYGKATAVVGAGAVAYGLAHESSMVQAERLAQKASLGSNDIGKAMGDFRHNLTGVDGQPGQFGYTSTDDLYQGTEILQNNLGLGQGAQAKEQQQDTSRIAVLLGSYTAAASSASNIYSVQTSNSLAASGGGPSVGLGGKRVDQEQIFENILRSSYGGKMPTTADIEAGSQRGMTLRENLERAFNGDQDSVQGALQYGRLANATGEKKQYKDAQGNVRAANAGEVKTELSKVGGESGVQGKSVFDEERKKAQSKAKTETEVADSALPAMQKSIEATTKSLDVLRNSLDTIPGAVEAAGIGAGVGSQLSGPLGAASSAVGGLGGGFFPGLLAARLLGGKGTQLARGGLLGKVGRIGGRIPGAGGLFGGGGGGAVAEGAVAGAEGAGAAGLGAVAAPLALGAAAALGGKLIADPLGDEAEKLTGSSLVGDSVKRISGLNAARDSGKILKGSGKKAKDLWVHVSGLGGAGPSPGSTDGLTATATLGAPSAPASSGSVGSSAATFTTGATGIGLNEEAATVASSITASPAGPSADPAVDGAVAGDTEASGNGGALPMLGPGGGTGNSAAAAKIVSTAKSLIGVPYVWGGTTASGVDCSGLVQFAYKSAGISMPRVSAAQANTGPHFNASQAQAGDLIAWDNGPRNNGADHIAIALGNGSFIEAARPGTRVHISKLSASDLKSAWAVHPKQLGGASPPANLPGVGKDGRTAKAVRGAARRGEAFVAGGGGGSVRHGDVAAAQAYAQSAMGKYHWGADQWPALKKLWQNESGWKSTAQNPTSTAYGIAQFLDSTWNDYGARKSADPKAQIDAGLKYIQQRYKTPAAALARWNARSPHWYGDGGIVHGAQVIGVGEKGPEAVIPLDGRGVEVLAKALGRSEEQRRKVSKHLSAATSSTSSSFKQGGKVYNINVALTMPVQMAGATVKDAKRLGDLLVKTLEHESRLAAVGKGD